MTDQSEPQTGFSDKSPSADFASYSAEEINRRKESETNFDTELHQEAVTLTMSLLKKLESEEGGS